MHPKRSSQGDGEDIKPVRSSDRLRRRPRLSGRSCYYYSPNMVHNRKRNTKTRTAASQIAKMLHKGNKPARASNAAVSVEHQRVEGCFFNNSESAIGCRLVYLCECVGAIKFSVI